MSAQGCLRVRQGSARVRVREDDVRGREGASRTYRMGVKGVQDVGRLR